ncbi:hypothetical protein LCGC14_1684950 [marine sediment metagenome]|uniref:Uncharacterized protein n=1 Tax=marine sediment metagenome TaxID=412755 RepID=A0A0F9IA25_9ZZZZ
MIRKSILFLVMFSFLFSFRAYAPPGNVRVNRARYIRVKDSGAYYTGTQVEAVLQEIGAGLDPLTDNSIADTLHRHTELVAPDGSPDPALSVDSVGRIIIGPFSDPEGSLELRTGNTIVRLRDTGSTATATTSFVEFGGTTTSAWDRTGYVGDSSSGDTHIRLCAEDSDLILGDSSSDSVLTLSGGNVTITGTTEGATLTEGGNAVPNATDKLSFFSATSSAELFGVISDETGSASGSPLAVFNTNPTLTGATMAGDLLLVENSLKLDDTLSGDATWSGITVSGTSGVTTLAVGDLCYLDDDGKWKLVDANLSDGYDKQLGICVLAAADGVATEILVYGKVRSAAFPAFTVGSPLYMSETAGDMTHTAPTTTDSATRIIGFAITAEDLLFNPSNDYYTHT